jgi:hypothetical protein
MLRLGLGHRFEVRLPPCIGCVRWNHDLPAGVFRGVGGVYTETEPNERNVSVNRSTAIQFDFPQPQSSGTIARDSKETR